MKPRYYLACDLGAESGRVMLGTLDQKKISLEEIHRFPSAALRIKGSLRWDILRMYDDLKTGIRKAALLDLPVAGLSTDSWGVDYVLLYGKEPLLSVPHHYRDTRTDDAYARAFAKVPADEIFAETGIQFMPFNTLYQLNDDLLRRPDLLRLADGFLNIGDYFNWLFSGVRRAEESMASTTQLYNPAARAWSSVLIKKLGLPASLFPPVVPSGTRLGPLTPALSDELGLENTEVIASCSHDTGAAVAAVPAEGNDWAYLSSGTWSLLGIETAKPIITPKSRELNFTNEVGYGRSIRLLKNIVGLWIVQECRRAWDHKGCHYSYDQLVGLAEKAQPLRSLIFPNAPQFAKPDNMPEKIAAFCKKTGQPIPEEPGQFMRCALESLAFLYRRTLEQLEEVAGMEIRRLHIVGGGAQNRLLNQLSANATGRTVIAGPAEATALGNVLIQALALGDLTSLADARAVVRRSFPVETFLPEQAGLWQAAYDRFQQLPSE
jgi:rhamnulokinase